MKISLLYVFKQSQVDKHTMAPLDELEPATKSWCQSHGVNVDTVTEILQKKPKEVSCKMFKDQTQFVFCRTDNGIIVVHMQYNIRV